MHETGGNGHSLSAGHFGGMRGNYELASSGNCFTKGNFEDMEHIGNDQDVSKESVAFPFLRPLNLLLNIQRAVQNRTREHPGDKMRERRSARDNQREIGSDNAGGISSFIGRVELFLLRFSCCLILTKQSSPQCCGPIR